MSLAALPAADPPGLRFGGEHAGYRIPPLARGAMVRGWSWTMAERAEVLVIGVPKPLIVDGLKGRFAVHVLPLDGGGDAMLAEVGPRVRAAAVTGAPEGRMTGAMMAQCPRLEIVSSFAVGYDNIDVKYAVEHGIVVCNTPEVLNEEVADTALGLLLCTVRELSKAERYLRAGQWLKAQYPLSKATLRNRTVGMVGMGRIGRAIARRLDGFNVPVVYHSRRPQPDAPYRHYPKLIEMARDVDTLLLIVPGGPSTRHLVNAEVLDALGPDGIVINMARGTVVDDDALIKALRERKIHAAGLDVFVNEPEVPKGYLELDNVVLLPHLGSATVHTRQKMEQLVVDNLAAWGAGKPPLTPVPETPWPSKKRS
jgi:lactate dehydrogenase-like 2-hydroxyacid dehydrogenase